MFLLVFFALFVSSHIPVVKVFNLDIISPDLRTGPPKSLFGFAVVSSSVKQQWYRFSNKISFQSSNSIFVRTYVGAPRALLGRQRYSAVLSNSTDNVPNGRLFGNIFECPNGTDQCRPILIESNSFPSLSTLISLSSFHFHR